MVTLCVLPPCCFHGDQSVFCSPPSSVIQTPLPLPVDKVSLHIWMHAALLQIALCVGVCARASVCVSLLSHAKRTWQTQTHTRMHTVHEWGSQLIEECRNGCQFFVFFFLM